MFSELEVQEKAIPEMLANVKGLSPSEPGTTKTFILILVLIRLSSIKNNRNKELFYLKGYLSINHQTQTVRNACKHTPHGQWYFGTLQDVGARSLYFNTIQPDDFHSYSRLQRITPSKIHPFLNYIVYKFNRTLTYL